MKITFFYLVIIVICLSSFISKKLFLEESTKENQVTNEIEQLMSFISINSFKSPKNSGKNLNPKKIGGEGSQHGRNDACDKKIVTNCVVSINGISGDTKNDLINSYNSNSQDWEKIIITLISNNTINSYIDDCLETGHCFY